MENDFIQGQRFKSITDYVWTPSPKDKDLWAIGDYDNLQGNFNNLTVGMLADDRPASVYTHGIYAREMLKELGRCNL